TNGFGYRPAPTNMTAATAGPLGVSGASVSGSGLIRLPTDVDYFSFTTGAGSVTLSAQVQTGINNLVPQLKLFDSTGSVLIASAGPDDDDATITTTLAAGSYRLAVADNDGHCGDRVRCPQRDRLGAEGEQGRGRVAHGAAEAGPAHRRAGVRHRGRVGG